MRCVFEPIGGLCYQLPGDIKYLIVPSPRAGLVWRLFQHVKFDKFVKEGTLDQVAYLLKHLKELFTNQNLAVIATQKDGQPYANLVAFTVTEDLKYLVFATTRATRKYANIAADSRVSVMVDNRENRGTDFHQATAVAAIGTAEEAKAEERDSLLALYLAKHPQLREFVTAPTCALLKVKVEKYDVVRRFQGVVEVRMTP
jgi:nitroimidazol reductase NimA-like FMN-containing flavoprotein (pyridoxamine 5'-phosphate oxidase superfamily)